MKKSTLTMFTSLLFLIITFSQLTIAQECDDCSRPRIALYDFAMQVARPDAPEEASKWVELFWPGVSTKMYLRNNEPNKDCLSWWDGALINAFTLQDDVLRFGTIYTNIPPAGPISSADYIVSGYTTTSGFRYESTLTLEAAESRELVKSVSVTYENTPDNITNAAISLAEKFGSVLSVIKEFERSKRDTDDDVAIRDLWTKDTGAEIKLTPAKLKVHPEESVDIDVEMIDCDGVPLGSRKIYFNDTTVYDMNVSGTTGGKIEPAVVTTDGSGKAKVKFIAGKNTGLAQISAFFPHHKPNGRAGGFIGSAAVLIGNPPDQRWILQARISEETIRESDTSWTEGNHHGISTLYERSQGTASITGFVENGGLDSSFYAVYYDEYGYPIENCAVSGFGSIDYFRKYILEWEDPLPTIDINNDLYRGSVAPGYTGFEFHYPTEPDDIVIAAQAGGIAQGNTNWTHSVYFPERELEHESDRGSTMFSIAANFNHGECTVTRTDSTYMISGSRTTVEKSHISGRGLETTTRTFILKASLKQNGELTGIKNADAAMPSLFTLGQNYPNPFNPATTITYELPESGNVSLKIYNVLGSEAAVLVNTQQPAGKYKVNFDAGSLPSGIYFYHINYNDKSLTRKMLLMK